MKPRHKAIVASKSINHLVMYVQRNNRLPWARGKAVAGDITDQDTGVKSPVNQTQARNEYQLPADTASAKQDS